ncbi:MAG: DUF1850 domain-containing protein [Fusobacteriaceae bacterium]|nr:DUF1850 domain-containing protein [Fusobacteriaceae bacterium]
MFFCKKLSQNNKKKILLMLLIIITIIILIYMFFIMKNKKNYKLIISHQITGQIYYQRNVKEGDILSFGWVHSFEHVDWNEYYRIENNQFVLFTIAVGGFGAGIPAEMDCTYRYENGLIYMENIKGSVFREFNWINSQKQLKFITIEDKVLLTGKDMPEHGRINLSIK